MSEFPTMTDKQAKELQKVISELTKEYAKALENKYIFKPMAFALYHVWKKCDEKEHSKLLKGVSE